LEAGNVILANGSRPAELPFLSPDGSRILTSRDALELKTVPRRLLVVGAGAIGLEIGTIFQRMGSSVTVLEVLPQILPGAEAGMARRLERLLKAQGMDIHTRMRIEEARTPPGGVELRGIGSKDGKAFSFTADAVLLSVGRKAESEGCRRSDLNWEDGSALKVDDHFATGIPGVYAIGDLIGGKLLAHKASHEGILAAENAAGASHRRSGLVIPSAVYTEPEFASVGMNEAEARQRLGDGIKTGTFSFQANGRALTLGEPDGTVKLVADRDDRVVGAHVLAPHASELIAELTLAVTRGLSLGDVGSTVHIHPTLSEGVMEAALHAQRKAVHALNL
jgi:dihydrolipoamide dehydrogenase